MQTARQARRTSALSAIMVGAACTLVSIANGQTCGDEVWTELSRAGPSERAAHGMVDDVGRDRIVLFGGYAPGALGDTWEWNGTTWLLRTDEGPPARWGHGMAYDVQRSVTVLFGGWVGGCPSACILDDGETWEWDGIAWTEMVVEGPSPRSYPRMVYDNVREVIVLFGGWDGGPRGDTWEWNGTSWTQRADTGPAARWLHEMAFDSSRGMVVMFGGATDFGGHNTLNDTWEWDGTSWAQVATGSPSPRYGHTMTFDSQCDRVTLFGGIPENGVEPLADMWEWNGSAWALRAQSGPDGRLYHGMVYDSSRETMLLFGGALNASATSNLDDTWTWDVPGDECPADLDGDGVVGIADFLAVLAAWGTPGGDVNGDGTTDVSDFLAVLAAWGPC